MQLSWPYLLAWRFDDAIAVIDAALKAHDRTLGPQHLVLVMGAKAGAALPWSPFEHWYAAAPLSAAGRHDEAIAVASAGLDDWPGTRCCTTSSPARTRSRDTASR